jgi:endonuclease-3
MFTLLTVKVFVERERTHTRVLIVKKPEVYIEPKARAQKIMELLEKEHADAEIALHYKNPLELLVATILSAQATDEQINALTPKLFQKYKIAEDYANADLAELEQDVKSSGFYHNKAKNLKNTGKLLVEKYNSQVPKTMEELMELPGVARKTANIVLYNAYGIIAGVAVDTHVRRLSQRLGLTENTNQDKVEKDLMNLVPKDKWMHITDLLIFHGRRVCDARKPRCEACVLNKLCPSAFTFN